MGKSNSFIRNSTSTLIRQVTSILIGLVTQILIARYLGADGQGKYALITLLSTLLFTFFNLGVGVSSAYYIGQGKVKLSSIYKTNNISALVLGAISFFVGLVVIFFFHEQFFSGISQSYLLLTLLILPILFMNQFIQTVFQGVEDFISYNVIGLLNQLTILLVSILLIVVFDFGINGAVFAFLFGQVITYIVSVYLAKKRLSLGIKDGEFSYSYFKDSLTYGIKAHLSNVMTFLNYRVSMLIISYFINPAAVGIYNNAVSIAERIWIFSTSISLVLFPRISSYKKEEERNALTSIVSRNVLLLSVFIGVVFYLLSDFIILLLFGKEYISGSMALKLLLPGIILGSTTRIISNDLSGRGKVEINMYTSFITVALNIVLNLIMVPRLGINGASLASTITYGMDFFIKVILFKRITGVPYHKFLLVGQEDFQMYGRLIHKVSIRVRKV
ncbi:flippase [Tepidibacillus fermentans]|uniref:O-antigen/teichoic acid export membrane protein n=1 Tax=Tepidibacillus fermentans TaxID=1281767 RepID=A0A4R3KIW5_9BACI|nr:flippase [Tepidibacillus fermentans]TCS83362.1 O-antigen/teichoic acid export membrane protein [Tepidibacillus fermentans]